jgi:hypothetical protein
MQEKPEYTIGAAARKLGVSRAYVVAAVELLEIRLHKVPYTGMGKGITETDFQKLRLAVETAKKKSKSQATTA